MSGLPPLIERRRRGLLARLLTIAFTQAALAALTAWLTRLIFDRLGRTDDDVLTAAALLAVIAVGSAWLRARERLEAERLGQDYVHDLRLRLYRHLGRLSPRQLQRRGKGGILLRFVGDLSALRQWLSLGIARLTVAGVVTSVALATLAWLDPWIGGACALILGGSAALAYWMGGRLEDASRQARKQRARLANNVSEQTAALAVVKAFGQLRRERRRLERQSLALQRAMLARARAIGRLRAVSEGSSALAVAAVLLVGTWEVGRQATSPGTVAAALAVIGLLTPYLRDLGRVHEYWLNARVAREKIEQFLALPVVIPKHRQPLPPGPGTLVLENVAVEGSLAPCNARIDGGATVALVGPNGAGKSTLLSVIARLLPPDQGRILLDGADLNRIKTVDLRRAVGIVSADLPLLRGSVRRNLRYRWPRAPEEEVAKVIRLCQLEEVLAELPQGEDTRLTEGGGNLSLGQRQRLMLARALLGTPRLLLLDEVDANLDPVAGALIDRLLQDYPGTILIVTHRLQRLDHVDQIWYLEDGRLLESGPPQRLLWGNGHTRRLFQSSRAI